MLVERHDLLAFLSKLKKRFRRRASLEPIVERGLSTVPRRSRDKGRGAYEARLLGLAAQGFLSAPDRMAADRALIGGDERGGKGRGR
jgi:hypothetical protein